MIGSSGHILLLMGAVPGGMAYQRGSHERILSGGGQLILTFEAFCFDTNGRNPQDADDNVSFLR
jgi:hypothetical protein